MGAIIMNGARIGKGCIVGAGSVIAEGKQFEDRALVIGVPARVIRTLTPEQVTAMTYGAAHYVHNGKRFKAGLKKIG
jgi:carbonic anhydrase/acetyltransferase-like protein (isoleucine patch superfamily)